MSNYTKSFNFRNGVQVDDSNFIVNAAGLVGIGTTKPEKRLDVRGNANISGVTSLTNAKVVGILTVGAGITMDAVSGIITAVKFVGDASGLQNIVAIATGGFIAQSGTLSTTAKIGLNSTTPTSQLDVVGDTKFTGFTTFTGITTSSGKLFVDQLCASGVTTFYDNVTLSGAAATTLTVSGTSSFVGDIDVAETIKHTGDTTTAIKFPSARIIAAEIGATQKLRIEESGVVVAGILSATSISGHSSVSADFPNGITATTVAISTNLTTGVGATVGVGTTVYFPDNVKVVFGNADDLEISHNGTDSLIRDARSSGSSLKIGADSLVLQNKDGNEPYLQATDNGSVKIYHDFSPKLETVGLGVSIFNQLTIAQLDGGSGGLSTYSGALRYGNDESASPYSTETSLDLINYDIGNINFYLDAENRATNVGNFHWWRGFSGAGGKLMTLTGVGGSLGIGVTQPTKTLHVGGGALVDGTLSVTNNLTVTKSISANSISGNFVGVAVTANDFVGELTGNVNIDSGISTFRRIELPSNASKIGIATEAPGEAEIDVIRVNTYLGQGAPDNRIIINNKGQIGIQTQSVNLLDGYGIDSRNAGGLFRALVVGRDPDTLITNPAVDLRNAGFTVPGTSVTRSMVLPTVNTTIRDLLPTIAGSVIYNSVNNRMELYNGTAWVGIATVA